MTIISRLFYNREIVNNCWLWKGFKNEAGYGRVSYKNKYWLVHRLSLKLFKPKEYNEYLEVLHKCHIPACFNPEHL